MNQGKEEKKGEQKEKKEKKNIDQEETENKESEKEENNEKKETRKKSKKVSEIKVLSLLIGALCIGYIVSLENVRESFVSFFSKDEVKKLSVVETIDVTNVNQFSYAVGALFAESLSESLDQAKQEGEEVNRDILVQAIYEKLLSSEGKPAMTKEQIEEIITAKQAMMQENLEKEKQENIVAGEKYREEYEKREGVKKTKSGVLYSIVKSGNGALVGTKTALVQYKGSLVDGTVFDSSENNEGESVPFSSEQVIPGLGELLSLMRVGDEWEIVIPYDLAYGEQGAGGVVGPGETLIFTVSVTGIQK
jgi:FKBP-type peptidyl-prolyl cis-trans isomerase